MCIHTSAPCKKEIEINNCAVLPVCAVYDMDIHSGLEKFTPPKNTSKESQQNVRQNQFRRGYNFKNTHGTLYEAVQF